MEIQMKILEQSWKSIEGKWKMKKQFQSQDYNHSINKEQEVKVQESVKVKINLFNKKYLMII